MSSTNRYRTLITEGSIGKENASLPSNLLIEKRYTALNTYRQANGVPPKPNFRNFPNPLSVHNTNVSYNMRCRNVKDIDLPGGAGFDRSQRAQISFERRSVKSYRGSFLNTQGDYDFLVDKENRSFLGEREERRSLGGPIRMTNKDLEKKEVIEPVRKSFAERGLLNLAKLLEPEAKDENNNKKEAIPTKTYLTDYSTSDSQTKNLSSRELNNNSLAEYAPMIMEALKKKDKALNPTNSLKNHKIPSSLRAKMVDWMIEVLASYKCSDQTFFFAVNLMDLYLKKSQTTHEAASLHLTGVTCMFMASKYEEIYALRLASVCDKIAHKKLTPDQIKQKEMEILYTLEYKLTNTTVYELVMNALFQFNNLNIISANKYEQLQKICIYFAKAVVHDYELLNQQPYSRLAASIIFAASKVMEQQDKNFPLTRLLIHLQEIFQFDDALVSDCTAGILFLTKNFVKLYPNLSNLKKFHSSELFTSSIYLTSSSRKTTN